MSAELIERLGLQRHPEGGWYAETFRSELGVETADGRSRAASTAIYFLLEAGDFSAWHRVRSDEVWHFYDGAPLELHLQEGSEVRVVRLGRDIAGGEKPQAVVPAGVLQAARSTGDWTLVGCTVAPGFDFADFEMPSRDALAAETGSLEPTMERFLRG